MSSGYPRRRLEVVVRVVSNINLARDLAEPVNILYVSQRVVHQQMPTRIACLERGVPQHQLPPTPYTMSSRRRSTRARAAESFPAGTPDTQSQSSPPPTRGSARKSAVRARAALRATPAAAANLEESAPWEGDQPEEPALETPRRGRRSSRRAAEHVPAADSEDVGVAPADEEADSDFGSQAQSQVSRSRAGTSRAGTKRPASRTATRPGRSKRRATAASMDPDDTVDEPDVPTPGNQDDDPEPDVAEAEEEQDDIHEEKTRMPSDPDGDKKVSAYGVLLGGRQFRCVVLRFPERGEHEFALSRDAAHVLDYRDANNFCRLNKVLRTVRLNAEERELLVHLDLIKPHLKNRAITAVYARDLFQRFGARVVVGGKSVIDDYYEAQAINKGAVRGELAAPISRDRTRDEERKRKRVVKAQVSLAQENAPDDPNESGSELFPDTGSQSQAAQLKEMYERRERERERERIRRRLTSSVHTHMNPVSEAVSTTMGDAGADPWLRIGSGAGRNAARKAALNRDGLDERNWMVKYALATAASARTHALARQRVSVRLPIPPVLHGRGEVNAPAIEVPAPPTHTQAIEGTETEPEAQDEGESDSEEELGNEPVGVYDPGTNKVHVGQDTQPTWSTWRKTSDLPRVPGLEADGGLHLPGLNDMPLLASRAWGVMSINTTAHLPPSWRDSAMNQAPPPVQGEASILDKA